MLWILIDKDNIIIKKGESENSPSYRDDDRMLEIENEEIYSRIYPGWKIMINNDGNSDIVDFSIDTGFSANRIEELKEQLRDTDWKVVEILEHQLVSRDEGDSPHDIDLIYGQRKTWRKEMQDLEFFK